jgi:hypothetical protein
VATGSCVRCAERARVIHAYECIAPAVSYRGVWRAVLRSAASPDAACPQHMAAVPARARTVRITAVTRVFAP